MRNYEILRHLFGSTFLNTIAFLFAQDTNGKIAVWPSKLPDMDLIRDGREAPTWAALHLMFSDFIAFHQPLPGELIQYSSVEVCRAALAAGVPGSRPLTSIILLP